MKIEPFQLEAGDRVRCVDATTNGKRKHVRLTSGKEYFILAACGRTGIVTIQDDLGMHSGWIQERFKPVVRVKAPTSQWVNSDLSFLLHHAVAAFEAMPAERQQAMQNAQRESWARGEKALGL